MKAVISINLLLSTDIKNDRLTVKQMEGTVPALHT